jgi:hypothetical protein
MISSQEAHHLHNHSITQRVGISHARSHAFGLITPAFAQSYGPASKTLWPQRRSKAWDFDL